MNIHEAGVLRTLLEEPAATQRRISERTGYSVGVVNRSVRSLTEEGYLGADARLTNKARTALRESAPKNAILLAAGFGPAPAPIRLAAPKAMLEVGGERLIERLIRQLREVGVTDITVVVGFMKESFDYLIDEFGVKLRVNPSYAVRNNLHSLALAADRIGNTYIVPCDLWCEKNPFSAHELYSWYMVSDQPDEASSVRVNRKSALVRVPENAPGSRMIGIAYLLGPEAERVRARLRQMDAEAHREDFWEEALFVGDRMIVPGRIVGGSDIVEIHTFEQLRELDAGSGQLRSGAMETVARALHVSEEDIRDIRVLKKGMTNRSFRFTVNGEKYIMRIPGEGTDLLIDRKNEAAVYQAISGRGLCDDPVYISPETGCKITRFLEGIRVCDAENEDDVRKCMEKLRAFHEMRLRVPMAFDIFGQIELYERLWGGVPSSFRDYRKTKEDVLSLRPFVEKAEKDLCLTHIDAVADNFLFCTRPDGKEELQLTDWEYAGMQDPHVDIAMFAIYSFYDREKTDWLIDTYFGGACERPVRAKIYCYCAMCGLLWSNWCEYKRTFGVEFGEYSLRQYRCAKDFYRYARELMGEEAEA